MARPLTPEHRARIAASHRGRPLSATHRAAISSSLRGWTFSPEHRAALSAAKRGQAPRRRVRRDVSVDDFNLLDAVDLRHEIEVDEDTDDVLILDDELAPTLKSEAAVRRACLTCGRSFRSRGFRLCGSCHRANAASEVGAIPTGSWARDWSE